MTNLEIIKPYFLQNKQFIITYFLVFTQNNFYKTAATNFHWVGSPDFIKEKKAEYSYWP